MNKVIVVRDLTKSYRLPKQDQGNGQKTFEAVKSTSFDVEEGEVFGILGPNGAGKTTTLEIIEGLNKQTSGTATVLGMDNLTHTEQIKKQIGVQLQSSEYMNLMTLSELLELFSSLYGLKVNIDELLGFVNLQSKKHALVKDLSGGQKQRFTLASALVNKPQILFLDEPTTGLDPRARRDVWELVKKINRQRTTVVLTTHYMEEAEYLCSRVAIMDSGTILAINEPKKLIEDLSNTTQISFLTEHKLEESFWKDTPEVVKVYNNFPKVVLEIKDLEAVSNMVKHLRDKQITFSGFNLKTASLEDVYLDLTGKIFED